VLKGSKVTLRPMERSDIPTFQRWINDRSVNRWLLVRWPINLDEETRWYDSILQSRTDRVLTIVAPDGTAIGNIGLHRIDHRHGHAELGIAIFEERYQDQGMGADAIVTLLRLAFEEMHLHRVSLTVQEANHRARRCYEKCGFQVEGMDRESVFTAGRYINMVRMAVLEREFLAQHGGQPGQPPGTAS
jgi:RimJ/RimL family protein N-acetyltransferase